MKLRLAVTMLFSLALLSGKTGFADLYQCGNTWTDKPCDNPVKKIWISPYDQGPLKELHTVLDAFAEEGVILDSNKVDEYCTRSDVSELQCKKQVAIFLKENVQGVIAGMKGLSVRAVRELKALGAQYGIEIDITEPIAYCKQSKVSFISCKNFLERFRDQNETKINQITHKIREELRAEQRQVELVNEIRVQGERTQRSIRNQSWLNFLLETQQSIEQERHHREEMMMNQILLSELDELYRRVRHGK